MARPAKSVKVKSGVIPKAEEAARAAVENKIQGKPKKPTAPQHLTKDQKAVFNLVTKQLVDSEILSELDVYVLTSFSIAVVRLRQIEVQVDNDITLLCNNSLMSTRAKYQSDMWRGCNELCLSPQARAKIGSLAAQAVKGEEDLLLKALADDD